MHEGAIPGTISLEKQGMMAESEFLGKKIHNLLWNSQTKILLDKISMLKLDRKQKSSPHSIRQVSSFVKKMNAKLIFFAGSNDWQSGVLPFDSKNAKKHSPFFKDSLDGLKYLLSFAEKYNFFVVYKPHPNIFPSYIQEIDDSSRCFYLRDVDAVECVLLSDLVVTICSSISYIALANKTPVFLIGRNQLSSTGAIYELDDYNDFESKLKQSLSCYDFSSKLKMFNEHVTYLLKYSLFPYDASNNSIFNSESDLAHKIVEYVPSTRKENV